MGLWAASAAVQAVAGPAAQPAAPAGAANPRTLLVLGDSLSAEYGLQRGQGWVALLEARLAQAKPAWTVVNASISGDTTSGGRARLPGLLKRHAPSHVLIELGGNDALRGLDLAGTQANLQAMVQAARAAGAQVMLAGMQMPPNYGADYAARFARMFQDVARSDGAALLPFLLAGVADGPQAAQWFQADRIHPNAAAQPKILETAWRVMGPWLQPGGTRR